MTDPRPPRPGSLRDVRAYPPPPPPIVLRSGADFAAALAALLDAQEGIDR